MTDGYPVICYKQFAAGLLVFYLQTFKGGRMYSMSKRKSTLVIAALLGGLLWYSGSVGVVAQAGEGNGGSKTVEYTPEGKMKRLSPAAYRKWIYVGTPITPNDMNDGKANFPEFHNVYMDPESFAYLEKTGKYRDGTVLVKELVSVGQKEASSGAGYFQGEFIGLEVSVLDTKRFSKDPGHWGYFSFGHSYPLKEVSLPNKVDECNRCHEANATDFVFSKHYPVIRAAIAGAGK